MTWNSQKIKSLILIPILFLVSISGYFADDLDLQAENFTHLTIEDGLPQNNVRCIEEDQYGFLWLCTGDGLVRYDGYEFELVTEGPDGSRISSTILRTIVADGDYLWIGTDRGLNRFDLRSGEFKAIKLDSESEKSNIAIRSIKIINNKIWIGSVEGVFILSDSDSDVGERITSKAIIARDIYQIGASVLIGNYGHGIVEIDVNSRKIINSISIKGNNSNKILNIYKEDDNLYISTYGNGLHIYDMNFKKKKHIKLCDIPKNNCLSSNYVYFTKRFNDEIWIGTQKGINILNRNDFTIKKNLLFTSLIRNNYITDNVITTHFSEKNIWFGLRPGGLIGYKKSIDGISKFQMSQKEKSDSGVGKGINDKGIYSVAVANDEVIVGTYRGLYTLNHRSQELVPINAVNKLLDERELRISSICALDYSNLIFGTMGGLFTYNRQEKILNKIKYSDVHDKYITAINCSNDRVFIVDKTGDIHTFDRYENTTSKIVSRIKNSHIHSILDMGDVIYFSTTQGLQELKFIDGILIETNLIFPDVMITKLITIGEYFLIGTRGHGLYLLNKNTYELKKINLPYNIIGNTIYDISLIENMIWLSTNNGLIQLEIDTLNYNHYVQSHGIGDKEYNIGALFYDIKTSTLYAGGVTSLTSIEIDSFQKYLSNDDSIISKLTVLNSEGKTLQSYYNHPTEIYLKEGNTLIVELGNIDSPIRYQSNFTSTIEKINSSKTSILRSEERKIEIIDISNLNFHLKIGNNDAYNLYVDVQPYIWKRWWSYLSYLLLLIFLIRLLFKKYQKIEDTKNKEELSRKELKFKRSQLASLSHELRTPLNAIIGITDSSTNSSQDINNIKSSAHLLRSLIDNALDSISMEVSKSLNIVEEEFNISDLVHEIVIILNEYIKASKIDVVITIDNNVPERMIACKLKIQQVVLNLLKNAIKHSKIASKIGIDVSFKNNNLFIAVTDDGIGINFQNQEDIFTEFYKVDDTNSGFGLGLYISKFISNELNGNLQLKSIPEEGSSFTLNVPVKVVNVKKAKIKMLRKIDNTKANNVLFLEDDPLNIYALKAQINNMGIESFSIVETYEEYSIVNKDLFNCIILDLNFDHEVYNGVDLAKKLRDAEYKGLIYILSAESDESIQKSALKYVDVYSVKPISKNELEKIFYN